MSAPYSIASREYLRRAKTLLKQSDSESMFYAAFELRCGIEARMFEYLEVWNHISKRKKKGWKIARLSQNIEQAFRLGDVIVRLRILDELTQEPIVCLYHTPVTARLRKCGERLGNYMHAMNRYRGPEEDWWTTFRSELTAAADHLGKANTGTLLGPLLVKKGTGQVDMHTEVPPGYSIDETMKKILNQRLQLDVQYLKKLPETFESEAVIWKT